MIASSTRSSRATRAPTYSAAAGTRARSDSTTGLRPATNSAASPAPRGVRRAPAKDGAEPEPDPSVKRREPEPDASAERREPEPEPSAERREPEPEPDASAERREPEPEPEPEARFWAVWPGRWAAGGVGPLPSSLRRPWPPVPGRGLPDLVRPAALRRDRGPSAALNASAPSAGPAGCPRR